jgi:signal peptidase
MDGVQVATKQSKQSKIREILKKDYVQTAILILILIGGMLSFLFGTKIVLRTDTPFMTVITGSMVPTLNIGDLIVVEGYADLSTIHAAPKTANPPGDILVFWYWDYGEGLIYLVHRAIGEETVDGKRYLITRGDHNAGSDTHYNLTTHSWLEGLPEEYVIGKVIANVPVIGQVLLFLQSTSGRIIIIALIAVLLIVEFVPFSKKKDKESSPEPEQVSEQEQAEP